MQKPVQLFIKTLLVFTHVIASILLSNAFPVVRASSELQADFTSGTLSTSFWACRGYYFTPNENIFVTNLLGGAFGNESHDWRIGIWELAPAGSNYKLGSYSGVFTFKTTARSLGDNSGRMNNVASGLMIPLTKDSSYLFAIASTLTSNQASGHYTRAQVNSNIGEFITVIGNGSRFLGNTNGGDNNCNFNSSHTLIAPATSLASNTVEIGFTYIANVIKFNSVAGNVDSLTISAAENSDVTLPDATRTGYSFGGWFDGSGFVIGAAGATVAMPEGITDYFAQWTANQYALTFDPQSGDNPTPSVTATYDSVVPEILLTPDRTGFTFDGYFEDPNGSGLQYYSSGLAPLLKWEIAKPTTLFAHWIRNSYTYTFDSGEGSGVDPITALFESGITVSNPTRRGYAFHQWTPALPTTMGAESLTFTASYNPIDYDIIYQLNSGVNSLNNPPTYNIETAVTFAPATRTGYTFAGWFSDANFESINSGIIIDSTENQTVHAKWTADSYTVTFNAAGGVLDASPKTVVFDASYGSLTTPTRSGYTFSGWFSEPSAGQEITESTIVATPFDHTVHAQWTPIPYTLTFDTRGGSFVPEQIITIESPALSLPVPTRVASIFAGWTTQSDLSGSGIMTLPGGANANVTLYALWEPELFFANVPLSIALPPSFYEDQGSGVTFTVTGLPQGIEFDPTTKTISGTPQSRSGLDEETFSIVFTITNSDPAETYTIELRILYNATMTFVTNGGNPIPPINVALGTELTAPNAIRTGYEFLGWHESAALNQPFNFSSGVRQQFTTLHAKWTPVVYTIFVVDGGTRTTFPLTYTIESSDIVLPTPSELGFSFVSWTNGGRIPAGSVGNKTFTATWTPRTYTLTILADGKQVSRVEVPYNTSLSSFDLGTPPAKEGHTAVGWDSTLPGRMPPENVTIRAVYEIQSFVFAALDADGNELLTTTIEFNATVTYPDPPEKVGFEFVAWSETITVMPANAVTVSAVYEELQYEITFVDPNGKTIGQATAVAGAVIVPIEPPTIDGFVFVEWVGIPEVMPAQAITITGVYEEDSLPSRVQSRPLIPDVVLPPNPDPVITRVRVNGVDLDVSIIPGQPVGVLPPATLDGYLFQGWMNSITNEMITPDTVINNPDFVVLVPVFEKAPSVLDAARNVFQSLINNPFTRPIPTNDLTTRTDNIQSSRQADNPVVERIDLRGTLIAEIYADGTVTIPLPNERMPLSINVTGLDSASAAVFYVLGTDVPEHHDAAWQPYTGQPFLTNKPNQQVFLMVKDAFETNQVTYLRPATFVTNADKIPSSTFMQVSASAMSESLVNTQQHTFLTQIEYEDAMVDMFVIEPSIDSDLIDIVVRYRANDHNTSLLLEVEAFSWFEEIILPGTSFGVYLRNGDNLDFNLEYRFLGRESVLESFQVTNSTAGVGILLPVTPNMFLRVMLGLLVVATIGAPYLIKARD